MAAGFNTAWEGFLGIEKLMDMSQAFLESSGISKQRNEFLNGSIYNNINKVKLDGEWFFR